MKFEIFYIFMINTYMRFDASMINIYKYDIVQKNKADTKI